MIDITGGVKARALLLLQHKPEKPQRGQRVRLHLFPGAKVSWHEVRGDAMVVVRADLKAFGRRSGATKMRAGF